MEAFTLLKYWRGGGALPLSPSSDAAAAALPQHHNATDHNPDDGPFFDLEFTLPEDSEDAPQNPNAIPNNQGEGDEDEDEDEESDSEGEREFKFTLSPSTNDRSEDLNLALSPSEEVLLKGKLVEVQEVEEEEEEEEEEESEPNSKPQFSASLLKSATKFRVFMLGLKKPKPTDKDKEPDSEGPNKKEKKLFTVKFKVEEVPIVSLFSRDNSSRGSKTLKDHSPSSSTSTSSSSSSSSDDKRFSKEVMHKYFKMVKPLYIRVSRRYANKLGQLSLSSAGKVPPPPEKKSSPVEGEAGGGEANAKSQKQGNLPAGLRVVCKHLGKSRSASSAVAASPPAFESSKRRDDSLLQQQDGIQGAILHCKRSFNASRESESSQLLPLPRCVSDPSHEIIEKAYQ